MEHLKLSEKEGVLTISLNRPEKRNAFFPPMIKEMQQTFAKAGKDKNLRAVVLTAEGQSFCSGGDLEWMKSMASFTAKQNLKDAEQLFAMFWAMRTCPVPIIGRVFGHCFGGGAGLTAVCDMVFAETQTLFSFSEVKYGLVPAVISPFVVERVGAVYAREWFMSAKVFAAPEARLGGLVNKFGSIVEMNQAVEGTVKLILSSAPEAVRETKKLLLSYSTVNWTKTKPMVTKLIAKRRASREGQIGLQAFLDKKSPQWSTDAKKD